MSIEEINKLLDERDSLYELDPKEKMVDGIQQLIEKVIKENFDNFPVDFILETYTRFGCAPNLIYDDNGMFAVTGEGFQPVVTGDELIDGDFTVFVQAKQWKKTIREALKSYLYDEDGE